MCSNSLFILESYTTDSRRKRTKLKWSLDDFHCATHQSIYQSRREIYQTLKSGAVCWLVNIRDIQITYQTVKHYSKPNCPTMVCQIY